MNDTTLNEQTQQHLQEVDARPQTKTKCRICTDDSENGLCDFCLSNPEGFWDNYNREHLQAVIFEKKIRPKPNSISLKSIN